MGFRGRSFLTILALLALAATTAGVPLRRPPAAGDWVEQQVPFSCPYREVDRWGLAAVRAPEAQTITTGTANVIVAVIDSGIDYNHPDLAAHIWQNPGEIAQNGIDDDGNGYIDDIIGINLVPPRVANPLDTRGHGTMVASIIASVAPGVKLMPIRGSNIGQYAPATIVEAIHYAVDNGASIINMSSGSDLPSLSIRDALRYAIAHGVLVVFAAGNDASTVASAAFYPLTMAVAATTREDRIASFSNYGDWVDVAAPGVGILGALPNGGYGVCDGTSFAAPFVSGAAALVRSAYPWMSVAEVISVLHDSADDINAQNPRFRGQLSFGRLNAYRALGGTAPVTPPVVAAPPAAAAPPPAVAAPPAATPTPPAAGGFGSVAAAAAAAALGGGR